MKILRGIIYLFLVVTLPLVVFLSIIFWVTTSPSTYKSSLENADVYSVVNENLTDVIVDSLEDTVNDAFVQEFGVIVDASPIAAGLTPLVNQYSNAFLNEEQIQVISENNIDGTINYLNSDETEWLVYIPKDYIKDTLKEQLPLLKDDLVQALNAFPTCTDEQLQKYDVRFGSSDTIVVDCIPAEIKSELLDEEQLGILDESERLVEEIESESEILSGNEFVEINELNRILNEDAVDRAEIEENIIMPAVDTRDGVIMARTILLVSIVFEVVLVVIYIATSPLKNISKLLSIRNILIPVGISILIPALIIRFIAIDLFVEMIESELEAEPNLDEFFNTTIDVGTNLINVYANAALIVSGGLILSGGLLILKPKKDDLDKKLDEERGGIKEVLEKK